MTQPLYLTVSFILIFFIVSCIVLIIVTIVKPAPQLPQPPCERAHLLGKKELGFYKELRNVADAAKLLVFAKVRMSELLRVETGDESYSSWVTRAKSTCCDFMLCDPVSFRTVLIIQLEDEGRDRPRGLEWNSYIADLCKAANIPILIVDNEKQGSLEKALQEKIGRIVNSVQAAAS